MYVLMMHACGVSTVLLWCNDMPVSCDPTVSCTSSFVVLSCYSRFVSVLSTGPSIHIPRRPAAALSRGTESRMVACRVLRQFRFVPCGTKLYVSVRCACRLLWSTGSRRLGSLARSRCACPVAVLPVSVVFGAGEPRDQRYYRTSTVLTDHGAEWVET
jgi:hypothetical protein